MHRTAVFIVWIAALSESALSVTVAFEQFSFPAAAAAARAAGNPTVLGKTAGETQWMSEQQGCAEPLLLSLHSFQQQFVGLIWDGVALSGLAVITLWLQGEFILKPCCLGV